MDSVSPVVVEVPMIRVVGPNYFPSGNMALICVLDFNYQSGVSVYGLVVMNDDWAKVDSMVESF